MTLLERFRSRAGIAAVAVVAVATSAGAATLHRMAVSTGTGSGGATTYLQSSVSGSALQGEVASSPRTSITIPFGVLGEYDATGSTFGIGVAGISTTGYGVGAESLSATQPSLLALNTTGANGAEIYGEGPAAPARTGSSYFVGGDGLLAESSNGNGIATVTETDQAAALYAEDDSTNYSDAVAGLSFSSAGYGLFGFGSSGVGAESETTGAFFPAVQAYTFTPGTELMDGEVSPDNTSLYEVYAFTTPSLNASGTVDPGSTGTSSDLQLNGDIYITGNVYTHCTGAVPQETAPATDCTAGAAAAVARSTRGTMYQTYASQHASATIEDEGVARMVNGYARVALDPAFASTISTTEPYLVFTTGRGDNRGLYVSNATPNGFDVHESSGGRSTLAFDYRIVAHPYGVRVARMAPFIQKRSAAKLPMSAKALARNSMLVRAHASLRHPMLKSHAMPRSLVSLAAARH